MTDPFKNILLGLKDVIENQHLSNGQVHHFFAHKSPENMGLLGIKVNKR